jgi:cell division protein FtsB
MKNYLFAPFKNDEDKIKSFNSLKNEIKGEDNSHYITTELVLFIGSLESYYDVIISELKSKNAVAVADERIIKELRDKLQVLNDDYNNDHKVHNDYEDGLLAEIKELKAELKHFKDVANAENDRLKAENKALKEQVHDLMYEVSIIKGC